MTSIYIMNWPEITGTVNRKTHKNFYIPSQIIFFFSIGTLCNRRIELTQAKDVNAILISFGFDSIKKKMQKSLHSWNALPPQITMDRMYMSCKSVFLQRLTIEIPFWKTWIMNSTRMMIRPCFALVFQINVLKTNKLLWFHNNFFLSLFSICCLNRSNGNAVIFFSFSFCIAKIFVWPKTCSAF